MSRIQGNVGFISSYEIQNSSPLDARQWVPFLSDLTGATTFGSKYSGMTVSVYGDTASTENNGVYYYKGTNQTNINSWVKLLDTTYNFVDTYITGGTYSAGTLTLSNNTGGTLTVSGFSTTTQFTGGTVSGATIFTNGITANTITKSGGTASQILAANGSVITGGTGINISGGTISVTGGTGGNSIIVQDTGAGSTVRNGNSNCASANYSTVIGGYINIINGTCSSYSTIGGGRSNIITGQHSSYSTIGGGEGNTIIGSF